MVLALQGTARKADATMKVRTGGRTIEIPEERVMADGRSDNVQARAPYGALAAPSPTDVPGWPKKADKWNWAFAQHLDAQRQGGIVQWWAFEPFSLWLPGNVRYKPDFFIQYCDPSKKLHFVEVKGWSRNLRDGITRYKIASALFPMFSWSMMKRKNGAWEEFQ